MPLNNTFTCGAAGSSLAIVSAPVPAPADLGANATWIEQLPPGATPVPPMQLLLNIKKSGSLLTVRLLMCSVLPPMLLTVMLWPVLCAPTSRLPKLSAPGETDAFGGFTPVPVTKSDTTGGELLLETRRKPLPAPVAVGWKITWIVQLLPTAKVAGQVLLSLKSPLTDMPEMLSGSVPVLVRVTVWAALLVFTT